MDAARDLSRIGQENPRVPSSSELDDQLFQTYFDWPAYLNDTEPWEKPSHRATPQDLDKLITEINPLIDSIESHNFFRMKTSLGSDDEVVTSSEYSGHPSPPELVQGEGSTSPSDHSGPALPEQLEEPYQPSDISLKVFRAHDDKWTYPQTDSSKGRRGYAPQLRVPDDGAASRTDQGASLKRGSPGRIPVKRPRQLENPDQTADVRRSGACLPCRVSKTRCHENGVCPTCRRSFPEHSHLVCVRMSLAEAWPVISRGPDIWSRNPTKESILCSHAQRVFTGKPKPISIFFSKDPTSPSLSAFVQPYRWMNENEDSQLEKAALSRDRMVSHDMLQGWVEGQIRYEQGSDFPSAVQRFLMAYSRDGQGLPKHGLVTKVNKMACFFRIWKTSSFCCRDPSKKIVNLPLSVQAELRSIVLEGIHRIELDILKELDSLTTPVHLPKADDKLALWACLWQLILVYRELTAASIILRERSEQVADQAHAATLKAHYRFLFDCFFPLITIFYHYQFRTKKSLEVSTDWLKAPKYAVRRQSKTVEYMANDMLACRKPFLQHLQSSTNEVDHRLCIFVVNHELKKLNTRKRSTKTSSKSKASVRRHDDDCDDDAD